MSAFRVSCSGAGVVRVQVYLGDQSDRLMMFTDHWTMPANQVDAGPGDDTVEGAEYAPFSRWDGGPGDDSLRGSVGNFALAGGEGNDQLSLGEGGGSFNGGPGNDTLRPGYTDLIINGGASRDTLSYFHPCCLGNPGAKVSLDGTANDGLEGGDNVGGDLEVIEGSVNADRFMGNASTNTFLGAGGADQLSGGGGNDYLYGEDGPDTLSGDEGVDYLDGGLAEDTFHTRDTAGDSIICGPGGDSVFADLMDLVGGDCESVSRPAGNANALRPTAIGRPSITGAPLQPVSRQPTAVPQAVVQTQPDSTAPVYACRGEGCATAGGC